MSDCRIPMPSYKAPIHTREQDELRVTAHFKDGLHPQDFVANRDTPSGTRVLDYLESDGERYERVVRCRDCKHHHEGMCMLTDGVGDFKRWLVDEMDYCSDGEVSADE